LYHFQPFQFFQRFNRLVRQRKTVRPHSMTLFKPHSIRPTVSRPRGGLAALTAALSVAAVLGGCASDRPLRTPEVSAAIRDELNAPAPASRTAVPARISNALAEPALPAAVVAPEPRLDLLVNNAQAREVFLAIVADTRYSMLMHPDVGGTLSVTLRGVTVTEALESIRDVYGYDFKIEGRRITIYAPTLQTRIFTVNYPTAQRSGTSELRVATGAGNSSTAGSTDSGGSNSSGSSTAQQTETSRVQTSSKSNYWTELSDVIKGMIGSGTGRSVFASPQASIMVVSAMPDELRRVDAFLKAAQMTVERQVMLEAKIVEVELKDGFQSGINWAAFGTDAGNTIGAGVLGGGLTTTDSLLTSGVAIPGAVPVPSVAAGGGLFGLALQTSRFAAVLGFLETQGDVQTLSSPRIATLNNQKAVLKVGTDDYFVTSVSGGSNTAATTTGSTASTTLPTLTLTSFFSGISLDVTPQIDDAASVMLHVHPSVTNVVEKSKQIDLGTIGNYRLPLASSSVNETDTLVRIQDGSIVAIGGLMQLESSKNASGLPGTTNMGGLGVLFGNRASTGRKKELVVLIKPSIIRTAQDWEQQTKRARAALDDMDTIRARVIRLDGTVETVKPKATP
jgi:MSHA biogenesis protein MshL